MEDKISINYFTKKKDFKFTFNLWKKESNQKKKFF